MSSNSNLKTVLVVDDEPVLRTIVREITAGGGHAGGKTGWIHVGVGDAPNVQVRVEWPDGETGPWMTIGADQFVTIERGMDEAVVWQPSAQ